MPRKIRTLPGFNGVAAGQTATIDIPAIGRYHALKVTYGTATAGGANQANMEAEITECRLKVEGKVQRRFTSRELFDINATKGKAWSTGILPMYFSEPWRRTVQGEDALAWGMGDVGSFQLEIDIDAAAANPTLSAVALWDKAEPSMGPIIKWRKYNVPVAAAGLVNVMSLFKNDAYFALHADSTNILDVLVKVDGEEEIDATRAQLVDYLDDYDYIMQADWFSLMFDATRRVGDALPMARQVAGGSRRVTDFQVDYNMSAAVSFNLLTETLGLRD